MDDCHSYKPAATMEAAVYNLVGAFFRRKYVLTSYPTGVSSSTYCRPDQVRGSSFDILTCTGI